MIAHPNGTEFLVQHDTGSSHPRSRGIKPLLHSKTRPAGTGALQRSASLRYFRARRAMKATAQGFFVFQSPCRCQRVTLLQFISLSFPFSPGLS